MVIMDHRLNDILEKFSNHEIYIWSNYGFNPTSDLDLKFVGEVNGNIAESLWYYHWENLEPIKLDITLYHDTKIFEHIPRFNRCKKDIYYFDEEIIRYKTFPQKNNEYHGREVEQIDNYLYKVKQVFARKDGKYKNRQWTYPILISDYKKLINN